MINVTNEEFLRAIFGDSYVYAHVTSFMYDPGAIPQGENGRCWAGGYYKETRLTPDSNQFYTVSLFSPDENGRSRRRKTQFAGTYVIGLDDVTEKIPLEQAQRLPKPSIVLKSSMFSEQWLYILEQPEHNQDRVDNLHDGLIAKGLAPNSKDPGQKGVTRYLRLPEGRNTKAKRVEENFGLAPRAEITVWEPARRYTMEEIAAPFDVDLNATRRNVKLDGAASVDDHPLLQIPDVIKIKEVRSAGRFDITCPFIDEHTDRDDSGSAIFTNSDGSLGFRCHHGSCEHRNGSDLIKYIDGKIPGWSLQTLKSWQINRNLDQAMAAVPVNVPAPPVEEISFMGTGVAASVAQQPVTASLDDTIKQLVSNIRREEPGTSAARAAAAAVLQVIDDLPKMDQKHWHDTVCDVMNWSKVDFKEIIKDLRVQWYGEKTADAEFFDDLLFVREINQFYDIKRRMFLSAEAMQNGFADQDAEARKTALQEGRVTKVDKLDYAPKQPKIFQEGPIVYGNTWCDSQQSRGYAGDISRWVDHFDALGWGEHRLHVEQWMAFTLRHPERKINHMIIMGSGEGCGKDFLLYPLLKGMGDNGTVISGEELLEGFNDYILSTKYLHINETELGDRKEAMAVSSKLKPIATAPPEKLSVNRKGISRVQVRNIINGTMTTNSQLPLRLNGPSRRFFALWSDLNPRNAFGDMTQEWKDYWHDRWTWMRDQNGWQNVLHYLYTEVDLSNFDPGVAPPVTDFLREIQDSSKSPLQQTIEAFIETRVCGFSSDLMTARDISDAIRTSHVFAEAEGLVMCDDRYITPSTVSRTMAQVNGALRLRAVDHGSSIRMFALRDAAMYQQMGPSDLGREYRRQMNAAKNKKSITVVK